MAWKSPSQLPGIVEDNNDARRDWVEIKDVDKYHARKLRRQIIDIENIHPAQRPIANYMKLLEALIEVQGRISKRQEKAELDKKMKRNKRATEKRKSDKNPDDPFKDD